MKMNKILVAGVIVLFLTMATVTATDSSNKTIPLNRNDDPVPYIEGILGENDWYISDVVISFSFDPKIVKEIHYKLGGNWHEYSNPFTVDDDGEYVIDWYWIDEDGKTHNGFPIIIFKLDQTAPTIQLSKKVNDDKITFTATCNDPMSGVERVEFYIDDDLVDTISGGPYQYVWDGIGIHTVHAVGYNNAGLSKESNSHDTTHRSRVYNYQFFNILLQKLYQVVSWIQQIKLN